MVFVFLDRWHPAGIFHLFALASTNIMPPSWWRSIKVTAKPVKFWHRNFQVYEYPVFRTSSSANCEIRTWSAAIHCRL
jgi:hypothetical protein